MMRESPALDVIGLLRQKGIVEYRDPYIRHIHHETDGWYMDSVQDVMQSVRMQMRWSLSRTTRSMTTRRSSKTQLVFDSRNATFVFLRRDR